MLSIYRNSRRLRIRDGTVAGHKGKGSKKTGRGGDKVTSSSVNIIVNASAVVVVGAGRIKASTNN